MQSTLLDVKEICSYLENLFGVDLIIHKGCHDNWNCSHFFLAETSISPEAHNQIKFSISVIYLFN